MLARLFSKLFGRKGATPTGAGSRPVSPPRPGVPVAGPAVPSVTPPPPPPPPVAVSTAEPLAASPAEASSTGGPPKATLSAPRSVEAPAEDPLGDPFSDLAPVPVGQPPGAPLPEGGGQPTVDVPAASHASDTAASGSVASPVAEGQPDVTGPLASQELGGAEADTPSAPPTSRAGADTAGGVRIILEDGTLAKPTLDPELEERLRYIVDNIVPPSAPPSEGPGT